VFTDPRAITPELGVPLVPTQLLHFGSNLLLALLLAWLWRRRPEPAGTVFWTYLLLYSISRGTIEFWRGDTSRGVYFRQAIDFAGQHGISTSQLLAAGGIVLATLMLVRDRIHVRRLAQSRG
jgi:prolipoprotein diacylglyceryltransferase